MKEEKELLTEIKKLLDWYGGVVEFEANMGSFWWTNKYGETYTMIVHKTDA